MPKSQIFNIANMSFNAIRENKMLAKISEFTVPFIKKKPFSLIEQSYHTHLNLIRLFERQKKTMLLFISNLCNYLIINT